MHGVHFGKGNDQNAQTALADGATARTIIPIGCVAVLPCQLFILPYELDDRAMTHFSHAMRSQSSCSELSFVTCCVRTCGNTIRSRSLVPD